MLSFAGPLQGSALERLLVIFTNMFYVIIMMMIMISFFDVADYRDMLL